MKRRLQMWLFVLHLSQIPDHRESPLLLFRWGQLDRACGPTLDRGPHGHSRDICQKLRVGWRCMKPAGSFFRVNDPDRTLGPCSMVLVAGVHLLTPGFFTDAMASPCLVRASTQFTVLRARVQGCATSRWTAWAPLRSSDQTVMTHSLNRRTGPYISDGEFHELDPDNASDKHRASEADQALRLEQSGLLDRLLNKLTSSSRYPHWPKNAAADTSVNRSATTAAKNEILRPVSFKDMSFGCGWSQKASVARFSQTSSS